MFFGNKDKLNWFTWISLENLTHALNQMFSVNKLFILPTYSVCCQDKVGRSMVSGNLDAPEGGFDAIMQALACEVCRLRTLVLPGKLNMLRTLKRISERSCREVLQSRHHHIFWVMLRIELTNWMHDPARKLFYYIVHYVFGSVSYESICVNSQSQIGWRDRSRRMLLFSTDSGFHYAGDGKVNI